MGAAQKPRRFFPHLDCARPDNLEGFLTRCASIAERQQAIGLDWPSVHGRMPLACHFSAARQLDHASGGRGSRFRRLCTPRAPARVPRTGAGPDGRAGSTALRSAAWGPPACAAGLMRSTRAHGAGIAAMAAIWRSPRGTAHERQACIGTGKKSKTEIENRNRTRNPEVSTSLGSAVL